MRKSTMVPAVVEWTLVYFVARISYCHDVVYDCVFGHDGLAASHSCD